MVCKQRIGKRLKLKKRKKFSDYDFEMLCF